MRGYKAASEVKGGGGAREKRGRKPKGKEGEF